MSGFGNTWHTKKHQKVAQPSHALAVGNQINKPKNAVALNHQIVEAARRDDLGALLITIERHLPNMNLVNLCTAVHRVAKLASNHSNSQVRVNSLPVVHQLFDAALAILSRTRLEQVKAQSVSNILWALATIQMVNGPLIDLCMQVFEATLDRFKPFEFSTTLWALAKLGTFEPGRFASMKPLLDIAAEHLSKQAPQFEFRCLSMVAWCYATAQEYNIQLFEFLGTQLAWKASSGCGQELSLTAWAFGTAGVQHPALFEALAAKAFQQMSMFKPQELSNLIWGFASSGFYHCELFEAVLVAARQTKLSSQHLANILWSFSKAAPDSKCTRDAHMILLPLCMQQLNLFKSEEVASVALSTAKAFGRDSLRDRMRRTRPAQAAKESPERSSILLMAFFRQLAEWISARIRTVPTRVLVTTAETFSRVCQLPLGNEDSYFLLTVAGELMCRMPSLNHELQGRIFQLFTVGEAATVTGMLHVIQQCHVKHPKSSRSQASEDASKASDMKCYEVESVQPTDEPPSDTEDRESSTSWESEEGSFGCINSPSHKMSTMPSCGTKQNHEFMSKCSVKNTFLHFNMDDRSEDIAVGSARWRAHSAPVFRGSIV